MSKVNFQLLSDLPDMAGWEPALIGIGALVLVAMAPMLVRVILWLMLAGINFSRKALARTGHVIVDKIIDAMILLVVLVAVFDSPWLVAIQKAVERLFQ